MLTLDSVPIRSVPIKGAHDLAGGSELSQRITLLRRQGYPYTEPDGRLPDSFIADMRARHHVWVLTAQCAEREKILETFLYYDSFVFVFCFFATKLEVITL
jgi:hypothetical protein